MRRIATALFAAGALFALIAPASAGAAFGPVGSFGGSGSGAGQFSHPQSAVLGAGRIFVANTGNARVDRLSTAGVFEDSFMAGGFAPNDVALDATGTVFASGTAGVRGWPLGVPVISWQPPGLTYGIAITGGSVYVSDSQNGLIRKYNGSGGLQATIGNGLLNQPLGLTADAAGTIYVADPSNGRIVRFNSAGAFLGQWLMPSYTVVANGQRFTGTLEPHDVAVDGAGRVFAPDAGPHSNLVAVFGSDGSLQQVFGSPASDPGSPCPVRSPWGVATSPSGALFVVSTGENLIRIFDEASGPCPTPNFGPGGGINPAGGPGASRDTKRPKIKLRKVPKKCARKNFAFRIQATDDGLIRKLLLFINHRRVAKQTPDKQEWTVKVNIPVRKIQRQLPRGTFARVLIQVKVVDASGKKAKIRKSFRICR